MAWNISQVFNAFVPQPNMIRDFAQVFVENVALNVSLVKRFKTIGLDWAIYNRGLAPLTISIDNQPADTLGAGGNLFSNGIKYDRITITATDTYTLYVAGVKF